MGSIGSCRVTWQPSRPPEHWSSTSDRPEQRQRDGELPGSVVIDRSVLEWRLDPSSPHRLPIAGDPLRRIVLVCNEGYSSSLAARTLQRLGLVNATDLCGGFQAWRALRTGPPSGRG